MLTGMDQLYAFVIGSNLLHHAESVSIPDEIHRRTRKGAYSFEITLDVLDVSTSRVSGITRRFIDHIFQQTLPIEDTFADNLEAHDFSALFEDID